MVARPLSCTHCGAGDVQEVKPDTYFCNYCEQVFKWTDPGRVKVEGMALGCEIRLQSGVACGVSAHARCVHCDRAICRQHTGYELFTATCYDCDTSDRAKERRREKAWKSAMKSLDLTAAERLVMFEVEHARNYAYKRLWWGGVKGGREFEDYWVKVGVGVPLGTLSASRYVYFREGDVLEKGITSEFVLIVEVEPEPSIYRKLVFGRDDGSDIYAVEPGRAQSERVVIARWIPWMDEQSFDAALVALEPYRRAQPHTH